MTAVADIVIAAVPSAICLGICLGDLNRLFSTIVRPIVGEGRKGGA